MKIWLKLLLKILQDSFTNLLSWNDLMSGTCQRNIFDHYYQKCNCQRRHKRWFGCKKDLMQVDGTMRLRTEMIFQTMKRGSERRSIIFASARERAAHIYRLIKIVEGDPYQFSCWNAETIQSAFDLWFEYVDNQVTSLLSVLSPCAMRWLKNDHAATHLRLEIPFVYGPLIHDACRG